MIPLIKKVALWSAVSLGAIIAFVFIFGSLDPVHRTIAKSPSIPRFESVSSLIPKKHVSSLNATQELATTIAEELIAQNPEGPYIDELGAQIQGIDPEELARRAIENVFSKVSVEDLRPNLSYNDIVIIKTGEKSFVEGYFSSMGEIFRKNFPATAVNFRGASQSQLTGLITSFDASTRALLALAVPEPLASMHLELISLMTAQRNAIALIKNHELDPAQATIALEAGERTARELQAIFIQIDAYIASHQLVVKTS